MTITADDVVDAGGVATRYVAVGEGRTVVLLHGAGPGADAATTWRGTIPALGPRCRVVAPDLVGYGATNRPPGTAYSMPLWLDHVTAFLDALAIERAVLAGTSFGAALALRVAAAYPDRVEGLVLSACPGLSFPLTPGLDEVWGYQPSPAAMRRVLTTLVHRPETVTDEAVETRYRSALRPGVQEAYASMFPAPRQRWLDAMASPPERVAALPHRTLIIHGRDDRIVPAETAWRLHHLLDRSRLHVLGHCGHLPHIEHPEAFNSLLADFLSSS